MSDTGQREPPPVPLADLLRDYPGEWVAVKRGEVVAVAKSPDLVIRRLRERQIVDATIVRAPALDEPDVVGLG